MIEIVTFQFTVYTYLYKYIHIYIYTLIIYNILVNYSDLTEMSPK